MISLLHRATIDLLDQTNSEDWKRIAKNTGLHVAWIRQLAQGHIKDAGASRLETLHFHFTGKRFPAE